MVLSDEFLLLLKLASDSKFLRDDFSSWYASDLFQFLRLEPPLLVNHLLSNLLQAKSIIVECLEQVEADLEVDCLAVDSRLWTVLVTIETVLECEGVHDLKLFPHYDPCGANLAGIDPKAARW